MPNLPSFLMGRYTAIQIVNTVLPLTKDDNKCGFKKAKKLRARAELIILINDYREGKKVVLPYEVIKMLDGNIYS